MDKFIKFSPSIKLNKNKAERANVLKDFIPSDFVSTDNFISYKWEQGNTLYQHNSSILYSKFLNELESIISKSEKYEGDKELFDKFYDIKN